jgi:hypothetical protein
MDKPPPEMSLTELQRRCRSEMEKFSRREPGDERYCLELFRRALVLRDERAWSLLEQQFTATILGWLRNHPYRDAAYRLHSEENYAALTIERLWMVTVRNPEMEFHSLAGALKFLRTSLNSVVIDTLRAQVKDVPIAESGFQEPAAPVAEEPDEFWDTIESMLPDPREKRLAYLLFHCNFKPRQVVAFCPQEFSNVREIFQMKRNIMDRLLRNRDRLRWLLGDDQDS